MTQRGVSDEVLLNTYKLSTLNPQKWEGDVENRSNPAATAHVADVSGEETVDPLGLRDAIATRHLSADVRAKLAIGSRAFDAKTFLNTVHPNATFAELSRARQNLRGNIDQRSEALKVLVNQNFDRFVSVKATTDGVFREMEDPQSGPLAQGADYGVQPLRTMLSSASARADQVFRPVLENNLKVTKLRNTLAVFERSHFFFNLPGSLYESVDARRYEAALRDYKKGKYLLETRPGQLLPVNPVDGPTGSTVSETQLAQQRRIFTKVWNAVEKTMHDMRKRLLAHLREPDRSVEEQERLIHILLELDPDNDPVPVYLDSQHANIQSQLNDVLRREAAAVQAARTREAKRIHSAGRDVAAGYTQDLSDCLMLVRTSQGSKPVFPNADGASVWQGIDDMIEGLCRIVLQTMPAFWRIAGDHAKGKFGKTRANDQAIHAQSRVWAVESVQKFIANISAFLELEHVRVSTEEPPLARLPQWVPQPCNSLSTTHFLQSILNTLSETTNELKTLAIPDTSADLDLFMFKTRYQLTGVLCFLWVQDAKRMQSLESWAPNAQQPTTTAYLHQLSVFNRWNAREAFFIAESRTRGSGGSSASPLTRTPSASADVGAERARKTHTQHEVHPAFARRIGTAFHDAIRAFLDGIVAVATAPAGTRTSAAAQGAGRAKETPAGVDQVGGSRVVPLTSGNARTPRRVKSYAYARGHHPGLGEAVPRRVPTFACERAKKPAGGVRAAGQKSL